MPPTITGITPATGTTEGGTAFEITGSGLEVIVSVVFGDIEYEATGLAVAETSITGVTPAHPAGAVTVSAGDGHAFYLVPGDFTFTDAGGDEEDGAVSDVKSVEYTAIETAEANGTFIDAATGPARAVIVPFTYEAASLASGSTIALLDVKEGDTVYGVVYNTDALGSAVTAEIGDLGGDTDYYLASASWASATSAPVWAMKLGQKTYTADTTIGITTAGATATGTIWGFILMSPFGGR